MGHDTLGFKGNVIGKSDAEEIAYLRRSMGAPDRKRIYELLGMESAYAGVSGNGSNAYFTQEQIRKALDDCPTDVAHEDQRQFLMSLLEAGDVGATVGFY